MIRLIITADDGLYERLAVRVRAAGDEPQRATSVLDGLHLALNEQVGVVVVDMSLHAADTLLESLHSRRQTSSIPLYAVASGKRLPFELRRLCTDVLEVGAL
jgi:ActR/RegA family two-component response regulator